MGHRLTANQNAGAPSSRYVAGRQAVHSPSALVRIILDVPIRSKRDDSILGREAKSGRDVRLTSASGKDSAGVTEISSSQVQILWMYSSFPFMVTISLWVLRESNPRRRHALQAKHEGMNGLGVLQTRFCAVYEQAGGLGSGKNVSDNKFMSPEGVEPSPRAEVNAARTIVREYTRRTGKMLEESCEQLFGSSTADVFRRLRASQLVPGSLADPSALLNRDYLRVTGHTFCNTAYTLQGIHGVTKHVPFAPVSYVRKARNKMRHPKSGWWSGTSSLSSEGRDWYLQIVRRPLCSQDKSVHGNAKPHPHRMREFTSRPAGGAIMQCQRSRRLTQVLLPICICHGPDMYIRECPAAGQYESAILLLEFGWQCRPVFECRLDMHPLRPRIPLTMSRLTPRIQIYLNTVIEAQPSPITHPAPQAMILRGPGGEAVYRNSMPLTLTESPVFGISA
ncbi:hypothetical protein DFH06DRAFT_1148411 [Mycena polygramma]|nr:hypothetical protein DFH06DRAFT_1148411 [Mycena polygramma]